MSESRTIYTGFPREEPTGAQWDSQTSHQKLPLLDALEVIRQKDPHFSTNAFLHLDFYSPAMITPAAPNCLSKDFLFDGLNKVSVEGNDLQGNAGKGITSRGRAIHHMLAIVDVGRQQRKRLNTRSGS